MLLITIINSIMYLLNIYFYYVMVFFTGTESKIGNVEAVFSDDDVRN